MKVPIVNLPKQYRSIKKDIDAVVRATLTSGQFIGGPAVQQFEEKIARFVGTKFAVAVNSGTDALILALKVLGIGRGDEVITTPFTFFATAEAIALLGARPVFVDIDPRTFNINVSQMREAITKKTRAILPVHLFGQMADMGAIMRIAKKHKLFVIEDAAQAIGATQKKKPAGSIGNLGCFSLFPTKNLGAYGDGGVITTNNPEWVDTLRMLRDHGSRKKYFHEIVGQLSRFDALQAGIVTAKLPYLPRWNRRRQEIARMYTKAFRAIPGIVTPITAPDNAHIYHQYTIRAQRRDVLQEFLAQNGIASAIHFPRPVHLQEAFRYLGQKAGSFPEAERACHEVLSLPMYPELSDTQVRFVIRMVREFYGVG